MSFNHTMKMQRGFHNTGKSSLQQRVAGYLKKKIVLRTNLYQARNLPGFRGIMP